MSHKRRGDDGLDRRAAGGDDRRRRRQWRREHLYLVLDDWEKGFSIHKMDADTFDSDDDSDDQRTGHLHEPPALRLEQPVSLVPHPDADMSVAARMPHPQIDMSFAALGTKIFASANQRCGLVYDAETAVLSVGAHAPAQMVCGFGIYLAVGEVLYALTYRHFDRNNPCSFQAMSWAPTAPDARQHPTESWSWKTLPPPTFNRHVHSYALHPDGRTIFMTSSDDSGVGTYSFDTTDSAWRSHGKWVLPFCGQGHYDSELEAWVGLDQDGYICCCQPVSPSFQLTAPCFYVDCKTTKEKMFSKKHMSASLTYIGPSRFCLVECVASKKVDKRLTYGDHDGCVIHLTMFGLKYNRTGELQTKGNRTSTRSFVVSRHRPHFHPAAFWM